MKSLAILSNATCDLLAQRLEKSFDIWKPDGFNTWISYALNLSSALYLHRPEVIFILLDGRSLVEPAKDRTSGDSLLHDCAVAVRTIADNLPESTLLVSTLDIPHDRIQTLTGTRFERTWEFAWWSDLQMISQTHLNVYPFELKELIEHLGRDTFYSRKMWYAGAIPYSLQGYQAIERELLDLIENFDRPRLKCLALDLDGTLWGGIVGEDGIGGIELGDTGMGAIYKDFQRRIKEIKETGILLVVLSKNNPEDVDAVFEKHPHMILKRQDFIAMSVNWKDKASNLAEIAKTLNLGLDSFVFVDDTPAEQQAMKMMQPSVTVAGYPNDKVLLPQWAEFLFRKYFFSVRVTHEDLNKTTFYQAEQKRTALKGQGLSLNDYLHQLNQYIRFHRFESTEADRVVQLLQKTNQFNLTGHRYTASDIAVISKATEHWMIYTVYAMDRFGDNGLVATVIVKRTGMDAEIDSFVMSCRVMGRTIEDTILALLEDDLAACGISELTATYIPSPKNSPVADFYDRNGYLLVKQDRNFTRHYRMSLSAGVSRPRNGLVEVLS